MTQPTAIPALKVHQWLPEWDRVPFDNRHFRRQPEPYFYLFSLSAVRLRALSGIHRRSVAGGTARSQDLGIQRRHEAERSRTISRFVRFGFPCSEIPDTARNSGEYDDLLKPGWLPTAIVVNIIGQGEKRSNGVVDAADWVRVESSKNGATTIVLPTGVDSRQWAPKKLAPLEIIDGQHRLWAFDEATERGYELPVVAFHNLDISWQAYLFWTINIRPKRINASLAFDLYPLLRTEDWLDRFEGHSVYRETRAQELTEALWAYPASPWYQRINMLGDPGLPGPRQAAWIRSLLATFVKASEGRRVQIGGLFGAPVGEDELMLPWSRLQQAAFLVYVWQALAGAVEASEERWAKVLRENAFEVTTDPAFAARESLLNTDQGVRGVLYIFNDLCFRAHQRLRLAEWVFEGQSDVLAVDELDDAIKSLNSKRNVREFVAEIADGLASFDWRTSAAPKLTEPQRLTKAAYRGAGGYKILRTQLLKHLVDQGGTVGTVADQVLTIRGETDG